MFYLITSTRLAIVLRNFAEQLLIELLRMATSEFCGICTCNNKSKYVLYGSKLQTLQKINSYFQISFHLLFSIIFYFTELEQNFCYFKEIKTFFLQRREYFPGFKKKLCLENNYFQNIFLVSGMLFLYQDVFSLFLFSHFLLVRSVFFSSTFRILKISFFNSGYFLCIYFQKTLIFRMTFFFSTM